VSRIERGIDVITKTTGAKSRASYIGRFARVGGTLLAIVSVGILSGCALDQGEGDYFQKRDRIAEAEVYTVGQALAQRKAQLRRAHRDLLNIEKTLESLRRHRYTEEINLMQGFVDSYIREQVDPLVSSRKTGWHPELVTLDVNLLIAKGAVLARLGDGPGVSRVIGGLESRFEGFESLLVEYPLNTQSTLEASLDVLRGKR
jgi:hypothetical protein